MSRRIALAIVLALACLPPAGCSLLHELKPHRLARWNQGPKLGRDTSNFSISDTVADQHAASNREHGEHGRMAP